MNDAERLARLGALLETALALPPEDRRGALRATAPELADEVLALLDGEDDLGDFLAAPAGQALGLTPDASAVNGSRQTTPEIPGFEIEGLLGEGGMGSVWLARQEEPVERRVAVKMIRTHLPGLESPAAARGFAAEQRALARLNHPAIAQLYDARTTPEGRPYVVMEHVDGEPVTDYADHHRLTVDDRLRLFVRICRGVEHAHRRALLHRDLKPSNLLVTEVDGEPAPKIIDFGIATALDAPADQRSPLTTSRAGTPHYVSPEALAGSDDLDTRTDIYSLGVVLHELLVGQKPAAETPRPSDRFAGLDPEDQAMTAGSRSSSPRRLLRCLRGDLDWIVLAALAADRDDRYGSAAALADDVERTLTHRPVTARPPSPIDRTGKLVRRNPLAAGLAVLAATALVLAAIAVSVALVRATEAERFARQEAAASAESLGFLIDLFEAARPEETRGQTISATELVAAGVERIEAAEDLAPLQRARLLHALADVQLRMGEYDGGRELVLEALELRESLLPSDDPAIAESLDLIGTLERRSGRLDAAAPRLERLVEIAERRGDPKGLADALNSLANLRWRQGRLADGEGLHRRALDLRESLLAKAPDDANLASDVAASVNNLGVLIWADDRDAEAAPYLRRAVRALENTLGPGHPRVADALGNLGIVIQNLGRYEESEELQRRSLAIREEVLGPDHPATAAALHNLGVALREQGKLDEAETVLRRGLEIRRGTLEPGHPDTLRNLRSLVAVLELQGQDDEAAALLDQTEESDVQ